VSEATLRLLLGLLERVSLTVGDPGFERDAAACVAARAELLEALTKVDDKQ
jgi:hypothetical protein